MIYNQRCSSCKQRRPPLSAILPFPPAQPLPPRFLEISPRLVSPTTILNDPSDASNGLRFSDERNEIVVQGFSVFPFGRHDLCFLIIRLTNVDWIWIRCRIKWIYTWWIIKKHFWDNNNYRLTRNIVCVNLGYLWKNFIRTIWGIINYISVWEYRVISGNEYTMVNNVSQNR